MSESQITVHRRALQQDMYYKGNIVLSYSVDYPYFTSDKYQKTLDKLNAYYEARAYMYVQSDIMKLYQLAIADFEYAKANDFTPRPYEVKTIFNVTYNQNCAISLYFDSYQYTGGAHGSTVRKSDSWNIAGSSPIRLHDLFPMTDDVDNYIIDTITKQIRDENTSGDSQYFDNYEELVRENFNPNSFYLNDEGITIYYQQYDIAPYSSGIPEFLIPYGNGGAVRPEYCTRTSERP